MKRKVIQLSEKTLVVSLPSSWIKDQNITKGCELEVESLDQKLVLFPPVLKANFLSTEINAKNISERVLRWEISSLHKQGYDEIVVLDYSKEHYEIIEDLVKNLFVGFIIKEQSSLRIRIGSVALVDANEFDSTLRRAFRLLDSTFKDLFDAFNNKDEILLLKQLDHEHTNNQLTNFCERLLNNSLSQKDKGHFWYVVAWNLEKIVDNPKYVANFYKGKSLDVSSATLSLLSDVHQFAVLWYELFYNFSFESLVTLSSKKKDLESRALDLLNNAPKNDIILVHYLHMIVLQLADFSASTIAIRFNE